MADFWGQSVPEHFYRSSHGAGGMKLSGQTEAIRGMGFHPSVTAETHLRSLQSVPPFSVDPHLSQAIANHLELRSLERELAAARRAAFVKRYGDSPETSEGELEKRAGMLIPSDR